MSFIENFDCNRKHHNRCKERHDSCRRRCVRTTTFTIVNQTGVAFSITSVPCKPREQTVTFPVGLGTVTLGPVRIPTTFIVKTLTGTPQSTFIVAFKGQTFNATLVNGIITVTSNTQPTVTVVRLRCCKRRRRCSCSSDSSTSTCNRKSTSTCTSTSTRSCTFSSTSTDSCKQKKKCECHNKENSDSWKKKSNKKKNAPREKKIIKRMIIKKEQPKKEVVREIIRKEIVKKESPKKRRPVRKMANDETSTFIISESY